MSTELSIQARLPVPRLDRRDFLRCCAGVAGLPALRWLKLPPVFAAMSPAELAADPRRPQYHLLPAANWMNDPNGPIYWNGQYHMFYQYNPDGAFWGDMHWGHAVSSDMVHWKHLPVALSPTPGGPDADGCFTGTAVVQNGRVVVLYTGVRSVPEVEATSKNGVHSLRETQCLAYSDDPGLRSWTKLPQPVVAAPPAGLAVTGFRDPRPWQYGDGWLMGVGSGYPHKEAAVLLYRSKELRQWDYVHPLATSNTSAGDAADAAASGDMWECPDFFPLGGKYVLLYSAQAKSHWQTGEFDPETLTFHPEQEGLLDTGAFYAAKTQTDKLGNRVLWGWVLETRPLEEYRAAGWAGLMSLPRVLTMGSDGLLRMSVAPEVRQLRQQQQALSISGSEEQRLKQISEMLIESTTGEIACTVQRRSQPFGLSIYAEGEASSASGVCLSVQFDPADPVHIKIDEQLISIPGPADIELNIFMDSSVVEVIVNHRAAHTKRFYYPGSRGRNLRLKWMGSTQGLQRFVVWQMSPISSNRLTT